MSADRLLVEVDLHHGRIGRQQLAVAGGPLVERRTEGDHDVGLPQQPRGQRRREAAGDAEVVGVAGEQAVAHRARGQQRPGELAERPQRRAGVREHGAAPGDDGRAPRSGEQVGQRRHGGRGGPRWRQRGPVGERRRAVRAGSRLHVERQHQHHRAALDARAAHRPGDVAQRRGRTVDALGHRAHGLHEPDLVDAEVRADGRGGHLGREHDQRRATLGRLGEAGHRVGQPRPLMDAARGEPPAHPPVAVGHADRAALVARRIEARAGVAHRVGDGEVAAAHEPEHGVHAQAGQRTADRLSDQHRAGDRRGASRPRCNQIRRAAGRPTPVSAEPIRTGRAALPRAAYRP